MRIFNRKKEKSEFFYYSKRDQDAYEKMIEERFGKYPEVMHEVMSAGLHIDVLPIPPSEGKDYYTLFTMGMGAYKMPTPANYGKINRAELAIRLPADWNIKSGEEKWYWPVRIIKSLARLPYYEKSWLGLYHDIDFGDPFSADTKMCGVLLDLFEESVAPLTLESGDQLLIYNMIPIYRSEMEYKNKHGAEALLEKMPEEVIRGPLDINRPSAV